MGPDALQDPLSSEETGKKHIQVDAMLDSCRTTKGMLIPLLPSLPICPLPLAPLILTQVPSHAIVCASFIFKVYVFHVSTIPYYCFSWPSTYIALYTRIYIRI